MNRATSAFDAQVALHEEDRARFLFLILSPKDLGPVPLNVCVALDRSGSMSGEPLEVAKSGAAALLRSLVGEGGFGLVAFDDRIEDTLPFGPADRAGARAIQGLHERGGTNLYGGWDRAGRSLPYGGRVVLLSDGHANVGHSDPVALSDKAARAARRHRISTTTIGIGDGYDEALLAGMANEGQGNHYFAHTAAQIQAALAQERASLSGLGARFLSLRQGGRTYQMGHLSLGEDLVAVLPLAGAGEASLRWLRADGTEETVAIPLPDHAEYSPFASLHRLRREAADRLAETSRLRSSADAARLAESLRALSLRLLAHPLAGDPLAAAILANLESARQDLCGQAARYEEESANLLRKNSRQRAHNLNEPTRAFFESNDAAGQMVREAAHAPAPSVAPADAWTLATPAQWRAWNAVPLAWRGSVLEVGLTNGQDGFLAQEIGTALGKRVKPRPLRQDQIEALWAAQGG